MMRLGGHVTIFSHFPALSIKRLTSSESTRSLDRVGKILTARDFPHGAGWEILSKLAKLGNTGKYLMKYTKICYCFFFNVLKVSNLYYVTVHFKNWYIKCIT